LLDKTILMLKFNKIHPLVFLLALLFLNFKDDPNRAVLSRQYNDLIPSLKAEPLKALPTLEALLTKATAALDERDTLLANIYFSVGKIYLDKGLDFSKALIFNEKALEIRRKSLPINYLKLAQSCNNTAMLLQRKGRFAAAKILAAEAVAIKSAAPKVDSLSLMRSLNELAINTRMLGDFEEAIEIATKVQVFAMAIKDSIYIGHSFVTLGSCHFGLKNYQLAIEKFNAAKQFYDEADKSTPSVKIKTEIATCHSNLGTTYRSLKKNKESLIELEAARKLYLDLFNTVKDSSLIINAATTTFEAANTEAETNKTAALKRYDEALKMFGGTKTPPVVECWKKRGDVLLALNKPNEALGNYQNAIGVMLGKEADLMQIPPLNDAPASLELLEAMAAKSAVLRDFHANSVGFKANYAVLKKCDTLISRLMTTYDADNSKYILVEKAAPIYNQAIALATRFHHDLKTNTTTEFANDALNFCEKNRAIALTDNLKDRRAKNFGGIPPTLLATERDLKSDIAFAQKELYDAPDSLKNSRQNALFEAKQAFSTFQKDLEKQFPKYFELKYQFQGPLSINALQSRLDANSAAIEYFIADSNLTILTFSKNGFQIFEKKWTPQYIVDFQQFRRSLSDEKWLSDSSIAAKSAFLDNGFSLYKTLSEAPLNFLKEQNTNEKISRLRIIPDGALNYLPFEMLLTNGNSTDWKGKNTPFLLREYAVSYTYSARLLEDNARTDGRNFGGFGIEYDDQMLQKIAADSTLSRSTNVARIADGTSSVATVSARGMNLSRLDFADDEVRNIGKLLGSSSIFLNSDATKANFLKSAPNFGILHLAMHGAIDAQNPMNSGLIFSKTTDSTNNYLTGYDLFGQQLHAGLAILSACNTGNGALRRGEGVMSLARAFAFAGCPSTVMSLWSIPDESTSQIMLNFYKYLKAGDPKDVALQKAKLDYLTTCSPQYQVPNYWGATVIIGNIAPVDFRNWYQKPMYLGGIFMLLLIAFGVYKFK
jgi:CHAT domain-containing protein/predicted negative regulator of RcsB-dependent stress response